MTNCVTPPPRLPQPAAVALAIPTHLPLNMTDIQNWHATNVARPSPMPKRQIKNPDAVLTNGIAKQNGAVTNKIIPRPILGPTRSTNVPIKTRQMMVPVIDANAALPRSGLVMFKSSRMTGTIGAAAKVETKEMKNPIQDMWKDMWCGRWNEKMFKDIALFSLLLFFLRRRRRGDW